MRIAPVATLLLFSLAACGKGGPDDLKLENVSMAEVAAKANTASAEAFRPGQWKTTSRLISTDVSQSGGRQDRSGDDGQR